MDAMDPLQQHLARFDRDGFAVLDFAQLPSETVDAYRQSLEPWADSQIAPNGPQQPETFRDPDRCVDRWTRARGALSLFCNSGHQPPSAISNSSGVPVLNSGHRPPSAISNTSGVPVLNSGRCRLRVLLGRPHPPGRQQCVAAALGLWGHCDADARLHASEGAAALQRDGVQDRGNADRLGPGGMLSSGR